MKRTDILIVGTGIAGATSALRLVKNGFDVTIVSKENVVGETNTTYAQGGIIYKGKNDSQKKLKDDILEAGSHINDVQAVDILVQNGPRLVEELLIDELKIKFDRKDDQLALSREGGHSEARILHDKDYTGKTIQKAYVKYLKDKENLNLIKDLYAVDLIVQKDKCLGVHFLDQQNKLKAIFAKHTILATGGLGHIYQHTTNPDIAIGDGLAIANRAGVKLENLEYVQFHPTTFYHLDSPRFLITEAARGEGATIVDSEERPIIEKHDKRGSLAPRDVVTRAIYKEMVNTNTSNVYLDMKSHIPKKKILYKFPTIYTTLLKYDIDITRDLIPIIPSAHYSCGGIKVVPSTGRTSLRNLYAIGEVTYTGLHGANRLASTSLLEGLVWADLVARDISSNLKRTDLNEQLVNTQQQKNKMLHQFNNFVDKQSDQIGQNIKISEAKLKDMQNSARELMWHKVGIRRDEEELKKANILLEKMIHKLKNSENESLNRPTRLYYETLNQLTTSLLVTKSALGNKQSLGCHWRGPK